MPADTSDGVEKRQSHMAADESSEQEIIWSLHSSLGPDATAIPNVPGPIECHHERAATKRGNINEFELWAKRTRPGLEALGGTQSHS